MIIIRGRQLTLRALDLADIGQVFDGVLALSAHRTTEELTSPEAFPHLLRVIGVAVRHQMPDATTEEIREALTPEGQPWDGWKEVSGVVAVPSAPLGKWR